MKMNETMDTGILSDIVGNILEFSGGIPRYERMSHTFQTRSNRLYASLGGDWDAFLYIVRNNPSHAGYCQSPL